MSFYSCFTLFERLPRTNGSFSLNRSQDLRDTRDSESGNGGQDDQSDRCQKLFIMHVKIGCIKVKHFTYGYSSLTPHVRWLDLTNMHFNNVCTMAAIMVAV